MIAGLVALGVIAFVFQELSDPAGITADNFPVAAVDYLEANNLDQARIYHEYDWGGYLIWRDVPTFIDGRADMYGDEFIFFYMQTNTRDHNWQEPLNRYDVEYILIRSESGLGVLLDATDSWQIIYEDDLSRIYSRSAG